MKRTGCAFLSTVLAFALMPASGLFAERFAYSQQFAQVDPWEERVNGKDAHEFAAMAEFGLPVAAE